MLQFIECLYNLAISNSVGKAIGGTASTLVAHSAAATVSRTEVAAAEAVIATITLRELIGKDIIFVRLAALTGLTAVLMNFYGIMYLFGKRDRRSEEMFVVANNVHFSQALAMMVVPFVEKPMITGTFIIAGTTIFCGVMYYQALTGKKHYMRIASMGRTVLALGWLTILTSPE